MKLIVDAQLPPSLAAALRQAGCDAAAVREIGLREAKDARRPPKPDPEVSELPVQ